MYQTDSGLYVVGEQEPQILHLPTSAVPELGSAGRQVEDLAGLCGLHLDPWQSAFLGEACTYRAETFDNPVLKKTQHKWAAYDVGLMISRQNGKGSILEARELAGLFIFGERLIIHSAHQFDTSREAFDRIVGLIENTPSLMKKVRTISRSHGTEGIELRNGQRLRFRTRTKGGGRGFTCDCLILDEAMILESAMVKALRPTLGARPNSQIWYTGSAGDENSEQFARIRQRGVDGIGATLLYAEWAAVLCNLFCGPDCDEHDKIDDPRVWAKANASLNIARDHGLQMDSLQADFEVMSPEDFAAEHLGVGTWPVVGAGWKIITKDQWKSREDEYSQINLNKAMALGIDTAPDGQRSSIGLSGFNGDDLYHVELARNADTFDNLPGTQWVVPRAIEIYRRWGIRVVVIDPSTPAGVFIQPLRDAGCNVVTPNAREYAQACGDFRTGMAPKKGDTANCVHVNQKPLNTAVSVADKRQLADLWALSKQKSSDDISPFVSVVLALWGLKNHSKPPVADPWVVRR